MIERKELLKTPEYWFEIIQNDIFRMVSEFINQSDKMNQTKLAEKLGVTKGYVSQVMNGNFNYTLKKLIELSLATGNVPVIEFKNINDYINEDETRICSLDYSPVIQLNLQCNNDESSNVA